MTLPVEITGGKCCTAKVTSLGQLVVAPVGYDEVKFQEMNATATAFNFYLPKPEQQFVITVIRVKATHDRPHHAATRSVQPTQLVESGEAIETRVPTDFHLVDILDNVQFSVGGALRNKAQLFEAVAMGRNC